GLAGADGHARAGAAAELPAAARLQLDVVDLHPRRHAAQRHAVADARLRVLAAHQPVAGLEPLGGQDVALLAVLVLQQGDAGRAVGVVLDGDDRGPDVVLAALEVDDAVHPLVAAAAEARGDDALVVAPALLGLGLQQGLLRLALAVGDLGEVTHRGAAAAGGRRLVFANAHDGFPGARPA